MSPPCIVLLGETGHGKSSIVNNLRDPGISAAEVGKRGGGVTRQVAAYAMPSEWNLQVVDTPGFGCVHMSLTRIIADVERLCAEKDVRGIAVTCPVDSPRLMLGTQVVQVLISLGVRECEAWNHIILVGTKQDKADDADRSFFQSELVPHFFCSAPDSAKLHALVQSDDCSQLATALQRLPDSALLYRPPGARELASRLAPLLGEEVDSFAKAVCAARQGGERNANLSILVLGECGDGKSTLINAMRDPACQEQQAGKNLRGVTKEVRCVPGLPLGDMDVKIYDTPGIGDMDISPSDLCMMLEAVLSGGDIDAMIVTCPATNKSIRLGGRVVQQLVDMGFHGEDRWARIILAGTKADKADDEERRNFQTSVKADFFSKALAAREDVGNAVLCSNQAGGYEDLKQSLLSLPVGKISYRPPPDVQWSQRMAGLLGVDPAMLEKERQELQNCLGDLEEQRRQLQETRAALAIQERDFINLRTHVAAEEARLRRELEEQQQALERSRADQELRGEADRQQAERRRLGLTEALSRLRQEKDVILSQEAKALEHYKKKLSQEKEEFLKHAEIQRQRQVQEATYASRLTRIERFLASTVASVRSWLPTF
ncbi:unnamed protein product [Symbiodinium sp. CCMP2592]|nr:unnamed protein product [Symbiodinium sp. CCMP2592]